jgi:diaminohydroxyphosphoribosylaminopyrimidine deaminase/5-amino-6-(5-phosphoribosylamino)uracil reductase
MPPGALVFHAPGVSASPDAAGEFLPLGTDIPVVLDELGRRGLLAVLVEAGPRLAAAFLGADVVDELWWFHAPILLGSDGVAAVGPLGVDALAAAPRFVPLHRVSVGADALTILARDDGSAGPAKATGLKARDGGV